MFRLFRAGHHESTAWIDPRPGALVAGEKLAEPQILQTKAIFMGPVRRALAGAGILPKIVTSGNRSAGTVEAPGALGVQSIGADSAFAGRVHANITKVQDQHVSRSPNGGELQADQHLEAVEAHGLSIPLTGRP